MVKVIIHWVRHGESCSNIANFFYITDKLKHPPLTDKGIIQASYLGKTYLKKLKKYHFIISSPLIRTLMTCFYSIRHMYNNEEVIPIYLNPNLDEIPDFGSNLGSVQNSIVPPEKLKDFITTYLQKINKNFILDYTYFPTNENNNKIDYSKYNAKEKMGENINKFYKDINKMIKTKFPGKTPSEIRIICYSHGGFIKELYEHRTTKKFIINHPLNFEKTVGSGITGSIEDFINGIEDNKLFNTQMLKEIYDINDANNDAKNDANNDAKNDANNDAKNDANNDAKNDAKNDANNDAKNDANNDANNDAKSVWEINNFVLNNSLMYNPQTHTLYNPQIHTLYNPHTHLVEFVKSLTEKDKESTCDANLFNQTNELFKNKYMKYKQKYLQLKAQYYKQNKN